MTTASKRGPPLLREGAPAYVVRLVRWAMACAQTDHAADCAALQSCGPECAHCGGRCSCGRDDAHAVLALVPPAVLAAAAHAVV